MSRPSTIKIAISIVSIVFLLSLLMLKNNFYAKPTYKKWGTPLQWEDFNGIAYLFIILMPVLMHL